MDYNQFHQLPIRSKREMANDVAQIIYCLHFGKNTSVNLFIEDLKTRALLLDPQIEQDVLMFVAQVQFQYDYDPWHKVTQEVQRTADKLLEDLGFCMRNLSE
ncbi:MAG: hypothetical protein HY861_03215 [Chlamydiia bacterium]|nr:hypothetical protein [Chlamydiia bacterium]